MEAAEELRALATRRAQARGIRQESEARKQSGASYADVDGPAAIAWLHTAQATTLIHGHTHRPAEHALAPGLRRVVLSDWDAAARPPRAQVLRLGSRVATTRMEFLGPDGQIMSAGAAAYIVS